MFVGEGRHERAAAAAPQAAAAPGQRVDVDARQRGGARLFLLSHTALFCPSHTPQFCPSQIDPERSGLV